MLRLPGLIVRAIRVVWSAAAGELVAYLAIQVLSALGVGALLLLARRVLDVVVAAEGGGNRLPDIAPEIAGLGALGALLGFAAAALSERRLVLAELVERQVHEQIIDTVSEVELARFEDPTFHDRLRRARVNAVDRSWVVTFAVMAISNSLLGVAALALVVMGIEPLVLPAVLAAYVPLWLATTRNSRASYDFEYAMTAADRERTYLSDVLTGRSEAKEIRLFGLPSFLRARYDELYERRIREMRRIAKTRLRRSLLGHAGASVATVVGVALLVHFALEGRISPSGAGVAAVALQQMGARLRALDTNAGSLLECSLFLEDLVTFLDLRAAAVEARPRGKAPESFSVIRVDGVSFTYPGTNRPVLSEVSMEIGSGEVVALVGRNGSGKTTLAKVLCGLYRPASGRVLWDETDVGGSEPTALRRHIAAIFQDFVRYELSAQDNIGLGNHERLDDVESIRAAAAKAGIDPMLSSLPSGYATRLSRSYEGGVEISTGEWQKVALARAFFRDAPFLVLDEPTASLDAETEQELFDGIRALQRGRAVLLISHRFSSVRSADRIYVMEEGHIIESGTHQELMELQGRYQQLFDLQAAAYLETGDGR